MADDTQLTQKLPEGFVVRTKSGKLMIVRSGKLESLTPSAQSLPEKKMTTEKPKFEHVQPASMQTQPQIPPSPPPPPAPEPQAPPPPIITPPMPEEEVTPTPTPPVPPQPVSPPIKKDLPPSNVMQPLKPVSPTGKAAYFIEAEDEEDIAKHREKLFDLTEETPTIDINEIIESIIQKNGVQFSDDIMKNRFFNVVRSRLIEMRNSIELQEALERSSKIGGMGLESGLIRRLMIDIEEEAQNIASKGQLEKLQKKFKKSEVVQGERKPYAPKIPMTPPQTTIPPAPERQAEPEEPEKPYTPHVILARKEEPKEPPKEEQIPVPPKVVKETLPIERMAEEAPMPVSPPPEIPVKKQEEPKPPIEKPAVPRIEPPSVSIPVTTVPKAEPMEQVEKPIEDKPAPKFIRPEIDSKRPRVTDIVETPAKAKILGPIDELADMSLEDFRRYGSSVEDAKNKILEKINLLEEESYAKRFAGIKAWRRSPVFQTYLAMGRLGIETAKPIKDVIASYTEQQKEVLSNEEFETIADLNSLLRY
ncbi:hypothetical protein ACFL0L_01120 [Patescibacteria group bacterium]